MPKLRVSPTTRVVLEIALAGVFITSSLVFPGLLKVIKPENINLDEILDDSEWNIFPKYRLKEKLKRLYKQKMIRIYQQEDKFIVQLTKRGKKKNIRYSLNDLKIEKPKNWDGKWRIVAYDIPKDKKQARDALRKSLQNLGFYELQKSVYLFPYPCDEMIEFIRELYGIGQHVTFLTVGFLENEEAYKEYFDI